MTEIKGNETETRTWKTRDGQVIPIKDLEIQHLKNIIKILKKKGFISQSTLDFYLTSSGPLGDMASYAFEREQDKVFKAPVSKELDWLIEELAKREKENPNA